MSKASEWDASRMRMLSKRMEARVESPLFGTTQLVLNGRVWCLTLSMDEAAKLGSFLVEIFGEPGSTAP